MYLSSVVVKFKPFTLMVGIFVAVLVVFFDLEKGIVICLIKLSKDRFLRCSLLRINCAFFLC